MDDFLKEFFPKIYRRKQEHLQETDYCKYDNQILTLFTSSLYFAALISTFGASYVTRYKGRKASILWGATSFFVGAVINAFAINIAMLIVGRSLLGVGIGFGNQAVPLYLSEMAPAKIRGAVNQLFQLTTCLGIFVANFINYGTEKIHPWGWRISLGLATLPAVLMFVGGLFLPETPNSLVEQGRLEDIGGCSEHLKGASPDPSLPNIPISMETESYTQSDLNPSMHDQSRQSPVIHTHQPSMDRTPTADHNNEQTVADDIPCSANEILNIPVNESFLIFLLPPFLLVKTRQRKPERC
nr:sugar transport protein 14-like [Ipomoea batatas]